MLVAMTMYSLSVAIHTVFAVSFLGASAAFSVVGPMMRDNPQHAVFGLKVIKKVYEVSIFPGIVVVFGTGLYQMIDADFGSDALWLHISIALFVAMVLMGVFVLYPATKTALSELEAQAAPGPPSEKAMGAIKKMRTFGPMMGVALIIIVFLMSGKPF